MNTSVVTKILLVDQDYTSMLRENTMDYTQEKPKKENTKVDRFKTLIKRYIGVENVVEIISHIDSL